jgi:adenine-specific DNA-methyltransferase
MPTPREKFQDLLKKLFQFDCAELDFGIYRIMNQKREVIEQFIETDLVKGIAKELKSGALAQEAGLAQQLAEVTAQIKENIGDEALDAEGNLAVEYHGSKLGKQYLALRERAGKSKATPEIEADIFNHLYAFFSRYYDDGDFMSLRRYSKRDKYAIPYNGEEVHLHWANADQYYIKTGENFTDYSYKHGGWAVQFKLRNADVEQNNVKGAKRFFIPRAADVSLDAKNSTLTIPFEFRPLNASEEITYGKANGAEENGNGKAKVKKKKGQEGILADAIAAIQNAAKKNADALAALIHEKRKDADGNSVCLLEHHLRAYTRANSTDFFIHKDLKGFLERELDFYLKNEVLNLDELEAGGEARSESWFQTLRAIKGIGRKIIAFVAQIEDFQKRLFEKKKFVTEVHYCVTLDRVPEELYAEIAKNKAQIEEWKRLFHIHEIQRDTTQPGFKEPLKVEFLKANPFLVLDTKFFSTEFKEKLLADKKILGGAESLDEATDGLLVHGENIHALRLLSDRYHQQIQCVHIDPPYNTQTSGFLYKNAYQHSSWLAMMSELTKSAVSHLTRDGALLCHVDENEYERLHLLFDMIGLPNGGTIVWDKKNPMLGRTGVATQHEYVTWRTFVEDSIYLRKATFEMILAKAQEFQNKHRGVNNDARQEFADWITKHPGLTGGERAYRYLEDDGRVYQSVRLCEKSVMFFETFTPEGGLIQA